MEWKDVAGAVGKAAPLLGTLLGGPAGAALGGIVASVLGTSNSPDAVSQALAANPDAAVKLQALETARATRFQELAAEQALADLQASTADRASARDREVKAGDTLTPRTLAFAVTVGFFGVLAWLLIVGKPDAGGDALLVMLGALGGAWSAIVAYYFGSSAGSQRKDELRAVGR